MQTSGARLRVVLDATPLLGHPTGIAKVTRSLMDALLQHASETIELSAFALTGRNAGGLAEVLPAGVAHATAAPMPAAILTRLWQLFPHPTADRFFDAGDIVHGTNFVVPPTKSARQLVTVHDLAAVRIPELCSRTSLRYPALVKAAVKRGAHVHAVSQSTADDVCELLDVPRSVVHVVHPGVPLRADTIDDSLTPKGRFILAIGTIEPRKDYATLVRAFGRVAQKREDIELVIAGVRGWNSSEFDEALRSSAVAQRIRVLGAVSDAQYNSLLAHASVLAYPSLYEGFGLPPLEAMSTKVPVVATKAGSIPEVCGDAALYSEPRNADNLATVLEDALDDDNLRADLIRRGSFRAASHRWEDAVAKFVQLYKDLAS